MYNAQYTLYMLRRITGINFKDMVVLTKIDDKNEYMIRIHIAYNVRDTPYVYIIAYIPVTNIHCMSYSPIDVLSGNTD